MLVSTSRKSLLHKLRVLRVASVASEGKELAKMGLEVTAGGFDPVTSKQIPAHLRIASPPREARPYIPGPCYINSSSYEEVAVVGCLLVTRARFGTPGAGATSAGGRRHRAAARSRSTAGRDVRGLAAATLAAAMWILFNESLLFVLCALQKAPEPLGQKTEPPTASWAKKQNFTSPIVHHYLPPKALPHAYRDSDGVA